VVPQLEFLVMLLLHKYQITSTKTICHSRLDSITTFTRSSFSSHMDKLLYFCADLYQWGLFAYIMSSWFNHELAFRVRDSLSSLYEKPLAFIQSKLLGAGLNSNVDLSPIVLFLGVSVVKNILA
jgi:uncharacterized protein YggT (Ycf19 family)